MLESDKEAQKVKKVLIITYLFPPSEAIGARRPWGLAKYLPQYDWQPIILTPKDNDRYIPEMSIVETPNYDIAILAKGKILGTQSRQNRIYDKLLSIIRKLTFPLSNPLGMKRSIMRCIFNMLEFPTDKFGWYLPGYISALRFIKENKIDAIISSALPFTSHLIAHNLKKKLDIPWIAEFRDPWAQSHYRKRWILRRLFDQLLEYYTIRPANAIISVSKPVMDTLGKLHKNRIMCIIENGYDPDDVINEKHKNEETQTHKFRIVYTGALWQGKRDPKILFDAISSLSDKGLIEISDIEIDLYCHCEDWIRKEISDYRLESLVNMRGIVPRKDALNAQRTATVLLHLSWDNPQDAGSISGKIYEYLIAMRPIIAFGHKTSAVRGILEYTKAGEFASSIWEMQSAIQKYYEYYKRIGIVHFHGDIQKIRYYSHEMMAQRYADLLDSLLL